MSRRKQLLADIEQAKNNPKLPFKGLKMEDETLFMYYEDKKGNKETNITLNITPDYPDGVSILFSPSSSEPQMLTGNLQTILNSLKKEYYSRFKIEEEEEEEEAEEEDDPMDEEGAEEDEEGEDEEGGDVDEEEGEAWEEEYAAEVSYKEHKELALEAKNYALIFGQDNILTRPLPLLESVEIELNIQYKDILEQSVCGAWGVDHELPIVLKIAFSSDYFLDAREEPKIEFYQVRNSKKAFKLRWQLEAITLKFIKDNWPSSSGKKIKAVEYIPPKAAKDSAAASASSSSSVQQSGWLSKIFGSSSSSASAANSKDSKDREKERHKLHEDTAKDALLTQLVDMGFDVDMARNALSMTNSLEEATNLLLSDPDSCKHPKQELKRSTSSAASSSASSASSGVASRVDELFTSPGKALRTSSNKVEVNSQYGFLVMLATFLRIRLPTLNNFCVICDQPHVFAHGNMLKPAVCSRELCCFSFQQLGVGAEAADDIATGAEVVDLLVCFATIAGKSPRKELIFEPFPTIFDPKDPKKVLLSDKNKDFNLVNTILARFPSVEKMSQAKDFSDMKSQMDRAHEYAYPLLQWIITSNRSHLVKIANDKVIKSMVTPHQYLLLSAPPEKEAAFRKLKEQYGSCFAFHGSSIENWHSILRTGLKNASGTKLQVNGAAYGSGIYLSPHAGTSFGYCRMYNYSNTSSPSKSQGNRFLDSSNIHCIAICEVIDKDIKKSGTIWVQPNPEYVVTRFFFVFTGNNPGSATNCNTEEGNFKNEIIQAIKNH